MKSRAHLDRSGWSPGLVALMGSSAGRGSRSSPTSAPPSSKETTELAQRARIRAMESDLSQRLPDIALPARATTSRAAAAVAIGSGANGSAELEILRTVAIGVEQSQPVRVCTTSMAALVAAPARTTCWFAQVARSKCASMPRILARRRTGQAMQAAVRPFTRAGAIEIMVDDREGARYVKVLRYEACQAARSAIILAIWCRHRGDAHRPARSGAAKPAGARTRTSAPTRRRAGSCAAPSTGGRDPRRRRRTSSVRPSRRAVAVPLADTRP